MATSAQTTYAEPAVGYAGQIADVGPRDVASANNSSATALAAGLLAIRSGDRLCRPVLVTDEPTADVDAIVTTHATSASALALTTTSLNGVYGDDPFWPPRQVTLVLDSHANWDLTTAKVEGLDWAGRPISEFLRIPDAGNVTLTTAQFFSQVTAVRMDIQAGTGGSFTVGVGAALGPLDANAGGVALYDPMREPAAGGFARYEAVSLLRQGRVKVTSETAVDPKSPVYVRVVATGDEVRGAFRASPDGDDCALLAGARWAQVTTAAGIAVLNVNL